MCFIRLVILASCLLFPAAAAAGEPFIELRLRPKEISDGVLHTEVIELRWLASDEVASVDSLVVSCDIDRLDWKTVFRSGDSVPISVRIVHKANRSFLLFRGRGEVVQFEVPEQYLRNCSCEGKEEELEGAFILELLDSNGKRIPSVEVSGSSVFFPLRLFPFVFKGRRAEIPEELIVRVSYIPTGDTARRER